MTNTPAKQLEIFSQCPNNDINEEIISWITGSDGKFLPLSKYKDNVWKLSDSRFTLSTSDSRKKINFSLMPEEFIQAAKYAIYKYDSLETIAGLTLIDFCQKLRQFFNFIKSIGVNSIVDISEGVCIQYVNYCKELNNSNESIKNRLVAVEKLYYLLHKTEFEFEHPWPHSNSSLLSSFVKDRKSKTKVIDEDNLAKLFQYANNILISSQDLIDANFEINKIKKKTNKRFNNYTSVRHEINKYLYSNGYSGLSEFNAKYKEIPIACSVIILTLSGIRSHELCYLQNNCYRSDLNDQDEEIFWMKSKSDKTYEGYTEWIVPPIVIKALKTLEKYTKPLQEKLLQEQKKLFSIDKNDKRALKINLFKDALLLTDTYNKKLGIRPINDTLIGTKVSRFTKKAGVTQHIHPHMFRKTFAVYVVKSIYGDLRYLQQHYKHWNIDMTALYASHDYSDKDLDLIIKTEIKGKKISIVKNLFDKNTILAGGLSKNIISFRNKNERVTTYESKSEMVESICDSTYIRPTGTGWCTSDVGGCVGGSILDKTRCSDCSNSIIEKKSHLDIWEKLYLQSSELLNIEDIGESGRARALRDFNNCRNVLNQLGVINNTIDK